MILSYMRTIILYTALILAMRLLGKRQIGQMEPSEFVVAMLVADLASIPMQNNAIPLVNGLVPILTVMGLELILSHLSLKSIRLRKLLCGKPVILIENGHLLEQNLRRTRVNLDELSGHLRKEGVLAMEEVQFAILETNGSITVFPNPPKPEKQELPYTVISDGRILRDNLRLLGRDEQWLLKKLRGRSLTVEGVLLMTLTQSGKIALFPRSGNQI